ncbi:12964_t:CDS:2, partial [Funneliformis mosseae]
FTNFQISRTVKNAFLALKGSSILENEEEGYDDEKFNFGGGEISKKNILSHDEEVEGNKRTGFMLGSDGTVQLNKYERRNEVAEK